MGYIGNKPPVVDNLITDIKIGEDDETKIDFADANTINFHANNSKEMVLVENALTPGTSDGIALGTTSLMWSDLFLASGAVMNFDNGDVTLTHSANTLTIAGGTLTVDGEVSMTTLDIGGTNVTATAAELNLIDGGATVGTTAIADGDGIIHNDDGTMKVTSAATFKTYFQSGLSSGLSAQETLVFSLAT